MVGSLLFLIVSADFSPSLLVSALFLLLLYLGTLLISLANNIFLPYFCLKEILANTKKYICFFYTVKDRKSPIFSTKLFLEIWTIFPSYIQQNPSRWDMAIRTLESNLVKGQFGVLNKTGCHRILCQTWKWTERSKLMEYE